jgi:hypothetical protein
MRPFLLLVTMALVACSQPELGELPDTDGYGPVGGGARASGSTSSGGSGGSGASGSAGSGSATPPPPSTGSPSQPPPSNGAGPSDDAGSVWGYDGGTGTYGDASGGGYGYDAGSNNDSGVSAQLLALCVSQINEFRAQNGVVPPYAESPDLEAYAAQAAASDAASGQRHGYFDSTNGGGVAETEDEIDGDDVEPGGGAQQTFEQGLENDEESNGNAAANLLSENLSQAGCGFAQDLAGNWWIDIALR